MNSILISIESAEEFISEKAVRDFCLNVLARLEKDSWELSLIFCSAQEIRKMNYQYRGKNHPTDVLSFSQEGFLEKKDGQIYYAGDIVICYEEVSENSRIFNVTVNEELKRVLIHGILHLLGYIHKSNDADEEMIMLQESVLQSLQGEKIVEIG